MPVVSFIVPVFNAENYLSVCLDSILNQTVKDIQIVCINDCSSDSSKSILELYADRDSRIEIVNFPINKGSGAARNEGIEKATGTYIRMVDADDFIPLDSTEKLVNAAVRYKSDFVRGGYLKCQSNECEGSKKGGRYPEKLLVNGSMKTNRELWYFDQHWTYLFRSDLIKEHATSRYDEEMANGEDVVFLIQLVPYMGRVTLIPETVYCYRNNPSSIMRSKKNKQYYLNLFKLYEMEYTQLASKGFQEQVDNFIFYHLFTILPNIVFPSIPDNLQRQDSLDVLTKLKKIFDKYDIKKLCFSSRYSWQKERALPLLSKQIVLLLSENYIQEAYEVIKEYGVSKRKIKVQKKKIRSLLDSTSWRITVPIRYIRKAFHK